MEETELTFGQLAKSIFNGARWKPFRDRLVNPDQFVALMKRELEDFYWVLQWGKPYHDGMLSTDEGMIQLATVFRDCVFDPKIKERYDRARRENDNTFLVPFMAAMRKPAAKLDGRVLKNSGRQAFLYLNWFVPLLNPELDTGLITQPVREIQKLAENDGHERVSDKAFEAELRSLGLLPFDEIQREQFRHVSLKYYLLPT